MDLQREFKINLDHPEDDADTAVNETTATFDHAAKIDRRSGERRLFPKVILVLLVLACLAMGSALFFVFDNLNTKIGVINSRGTAGIATISKALDDKFSELSDHFTTQMEATREMLSEVDGRVAKLTARVAALSDNKLDKKEVPETINKEIEKKLAGDIAPMAASIQNIGEQITGLHETAQKLSENMKKNQTGVLNNKKEISTLDAIHVDRQTFDQELKKEREFNQQNMAHATEALFSEMAALRQQIKDLDSKIEQLDTALKTHPSSKQPEKGPKSPSDTLTVPKPGQIIEQELN